MKIRPEIEQSYQSKRLFKLPLIKTAGFRMAISSFQFKVPAILSDVVRGKDVVVND